jgi:F420-non-reducing hydrogenase iron-sulfur subunit
MCSGRVDMRFIIRAFSNGADGVFVGGCHLNDCHYNPEGNYDALMMSKIFSKLLKRIGVNPERFRLEWVSAGEGIRFAEIMNDFSKKIKELGSIGVGEEIDHKTLGSKFESVSKLVPYIKLVERERLRLPIRTEAEYEKFFSGDEFGRLFNETIGDKLVLSRIMLLLQERPLSMGQLTNRLSLNPSEVSKSINTGIRHGFIWYDESNKYYKMVN